MLVGIENTSFNYENNNSEMNSSINSLQKDDFLKLLIAQIQNQDPTEPMTPQQLTEQLTALAQLEQTYNFVDTLNDFGEVIKNLDMTNIVSLIGKNVKTDQGVISADGSIKAGYSLPVPAELVKIQIFDRDGNLVRELKIPSVGIGEHAFEWDGRDNYGNKLTGTYYFNVLAYNSEGELIDGVSTYSLGLIDGVNLKEKTVYLQGIEIPMDSILEVLTS
jgi:flagellar basal-body rod modification protein FlgD